MPAGCVGSVNKVGRCSTLASLYIHACVRSPAKVTRTQAIVLCSQLPQPHHQLLGFSHEWRHLAVHLWRLPQGALLTLEAKGREGAVVRSCNSKQDKGKTTGRPQHAHTVSWLAAKTVVRQITLAYTIRSPLRAMAAANSWGQ